MARTPESIENELLVLAAQDGDRAALTALVRRWRGPFVAYARRVVGRGDAAEDAVQDAWLAIVRGLRRLQDPTSFPAWAFRIVHNKSVDSVNRGARDKRLIDGAARDVQARAPGRDGDVVDDLREAIDRLPSGQRALLHLRYAEGFPVADIARVLGVPVGTVKSRLHHARAELKEAIEHKKGALT